LTRVKRIAFVVWLCLVGPAWAASPLEYTHATLEQARAIVSSDQNHNEKLAALSVLFTKFLDTDAMGRAALGKHWSSFTPQQQKEFLVLFRELLLRTYVQKLLLFEKPTFAYVDEVRQDGEASVNTKIVTTRDDFNVVYQLRPEGERWLVTKIMVENVSLTANLGSQLDHLLSRASVEDVLNLMRRKYGSNGGGLNHEGICHHAQGSPPHWS
jgi:phospholipid transport system substrate-binding protein